MATRLIGRPLHYVIKIGDRRKAIDFYVEKLGMRVLRHEEFVEGCKADCNGPFNGIWSKTMVGYGSEDDNFVIEMTYNYEIGGYKRGNDLHGLYLCNQPLFENLLSGGHEKNEEGLLSLRDPDGNAIFVGDGEFGPAICRIALNVTDLDRSVAFWSDALGMNVAHEGSDEVRLQYEGNTPRNWQLVLRSLRGELINRASAYGRTAFACPTDKLPALEEAVKQSTLKTGGSVLKPLVALDTPGKATVHVVILADPDGHEICFVGCEAFRELSKEDESSPEELERAMKKDTSDEWFEGGKPIV